LQKINHRPSICYHFVSFRTTRQFCVPPKRPNFVQKRSNTYTVSIRPPLWMDFSQNWPKISQIGRISSEFAHKRPVMGWMLAKLDWIRPKSVAELNWTYSTVFNEFWPFLAKRKISFLVFLRDGFPFYWSWQKILLCMSANPDFRPRFLLCRNLQ
jgi:hypothetical protein